MAELAIPLRIDITADGTAAVTEIQNVGNAAQAAGQQAGNLASNSQNAASGIQSMGTSAQSATNQLKSVSDQLTKIGSSMTKLVTAPIVAAYTASVKGAADLTETVSKTETVFGNFYSNVERWSETSIETMGIAQSTALEMASLYGDMATGMGFSQSAASEMSMSLTSLAADLASFKNISIDTAETALKSVFTGETESLKNLGVVMTEANLKAYALSQGIETEYSAMSQAEKVTLRYQYVMAQTSNAQGDFTRTGDSLSNKLRKLGQTIKQVGEQIGQLIVPYVTAIVDKIQAAVTWVSNLDDGMKNTILTIGAIVAAIGPALLIGGKVLKLVQAIKAAASLSTLLPVVAAIAAAVAGATLLISAFKDTSDELETTTTVYNNAKEIIEEGIDTKVTVDDQELDDLESRTVDGGTVTIGASDETKAIISDIKEIADDLQNSATKMTGSITLNGSTTEAQAALQAVQDEVSALLTASEDGSSVSIADLQAAIDKCKALEIDPNMDAEKAQAIQDQLDAMALDVEKLAGVTVKFADDEDTQGTVNDLTSLLDELHNNSNFTKEIRLNGDNAAALEALDGLDKAVQGLINGDGTITELQAAIDACEKLEIDPTIDYTLYTALNNKLKHLRTLCDDIRSVDVVFTMVDDSAEEDKTNVEKFIEQAEKLDATPKNFAITASFSVDETTLSDIEEYVEGVADAATKTGEYADAVEHLNSLVDNNTEEKIAEINSQMAEQFLQIQKNYNNGGYGSYDEYLADIQAVIDAGDEAKQAVYDEADAVKELNDQLANGEAADDAETVAEILTRAFDTSDLVVSAEDYESAAAWLKEYGPAAEGAMETAATAVQGLRDTTLQNFVDMQAAVDAYNESMQTAADKEAEAAEQLDGIQMTSDIKTLLGIFAGDMDKNSLGYAGKTSAGAIGMFSDTAFTYKNDNYSDWVNEMLGDSEQLEALLTRIYTINEETGELAPTTYMATRNNGVIEGLQDDIETAESTAETLNTEAETIRTQATEDFETALQTIADATKFDSEGISGLLTLAEEAGVAIDEADKEMLTGSQAFFDDLNTRVKTSQTSVSGAISEVTNAMSSAEQITTAANGGDSIGVAFDGGIEEAIGSNSGPIYEKVRTLVQNMIHEAEKAQDSHSPSKITRDRIGKMFMKGISLGVQDETPSVLERIKSGMNKIISGAQSIVTGSSLSFPTTLALSNGMNIDYNRMGEALSSAVQDSPVSLVIKDKTIAETTSDATWRAQAIKAQRINRGKGRW